VRPRHARFAPPPENAGLRAVESEFELLVIGHGCHNFFGFNYDAIFAVGVGQRLSKAKFI
jgi:hypothetical protein